MPKNPKPSQQKLFGPVMSVVFTVSGFFAAQFWAGVLIAPFLLLFRSDSAEALDLLQNNAWASFGFIILLEAITLWIIYTLLHVEFGSTFKTLGFNRPRNKYIAYALAGFAVYFVFYIVGVLIAKQLAPGIDLEKEQDIGFDTSARGITLLPIFLSLVILPPITEEIVARGFLFGGLRSKLSFLPAAAATSVVFAAAHLGGAKEGLLWVATIDTFILSLVLCYLREKTGSLWPSIGVHALKNGLAFIVLFNIVGYIR